VVLWLLLLLVRLIPFVWGFLIGGLVFLTPFLKLKLRLACVLVAAPFRLVSKGLYLEVSKEVEWIVRARHGKKDLREGYAKLLEKARHG
jgi:hypothetical protein